MNHKVLYLCGMLSPLLYLTMTILGAALRPNYSHVSDTVSELFSPGPYKSILLDSLHVSVALLSILFGIGVFQFVHRSVQHNLVGLAGAGLIIAGGVVNVATATFFPQDAWGSPFTFSGQMHIVLVSVLALFAILSTLLMGIWTYRAKIFPGFGIYSYVSVAAFVITGVVAVSTLGTPIMGLTERIAVLTGLQWTFVLALLLFLKTRHRPN